MAGGPLVALFAIAIASQLQSSPAAPSPVPACWAPAAQLVSASGFAAAAYPLVLLVGAQFPLEPGGGHPAVIFQWRWAGM